jgi:hypothetical protein
MMHLDFSLCLTRRSFLPAALFLSLSVAAVTGCRSRPEPPAPARVVEAPRAPVPQISPWPGTLASALRAAESARYNEADRILLEFSVKHANTPEGAESDFWRALLKTDPANSKVTAREQLALLDGYLDNGPNAPRYAEVQILRRVVEASDSTHALLTTVRLSAEAREKARDEEIRRLNELYDRTAAELDRIKRRLAPKP